ncbi:dipeptide ABC transporter ATP-binding protein [Musicola paradisiaca]|uniref:ABC-type dipeptide transporter n=1 Tax=Musicola paradisiaca (strain Ech703) TaxID=579405 RepID=C6C523_MUSP7|nr:ABC transporter ATP-binding protein [Musicola paradisiaca]ACS85633.1 ABC transporter related [Musicola paradisiaca Ech703]
MSAVFALDSDPQLTPIADPALLTIDRLRVALPAGGDRADAIEDLSLTLHPGQTLCVVGESGSGKSVLAMTLMGLLAGELTVRHGTVRLGDTLLLNQGRYAAPAVLKALRGAQIGMVFQEPMTALNPVVICGKQMDEMLRAHSRMSRDERKAAILAIFARVQLPDPERIYHSYPHQLSGGQRQRIVIAMAVILRPRLLICDEPTTALDVTTQREILSLIRELQQENGCAVLFITHDMGVVAEIADDVLVMHLGAVVEQGAAAQVLRQPSQAYTRMLLDCVPDGVPCRSGDKQRGTPLLNADAVVKNYVRRTFLGRRQTVAALRDASLAVHYGETVGIVGESGSGKSTFARCLMRLIDPSSGVIQWGEKAVQSLPERQLWSLRSQVQMVFQDPNRSFNPRRTVGSSIREGAMNFGLSRESAQALAETLMDRIRLPRESLSRYPHQFSGGQRQRLAIARALACKPRVLVADEAVSALDVSVQQQILALLEEIQRDLGLGMIFVTHDLRVAARLCDRLIVMQQGAIIEQGPTAQLFAAPQQAYTRSLLQAMPRWVTPSRA